MPPLDSFAGAGIVAGIIAILIGAAGCFFGYRIFRLLLGLIGFALGSALGSAAAVSITGGETLWIVVGALIGGIIGAVLLAALHFLGVFVIGALSGGLLGATLAGAIGLEGASTAAFIIMAIAGGVLALVLQKAVIIISTALTGAWSIAWGLYIVFGGGLGGLNVTGLSRASLGSSPDVVLVLWLLFAVAGIVIQFTVTAREKPAPSTTPPTPIMAPPAAAAPAADLAVPGAFCPNCGQPLAQGTRFCGSCGAEVAHLWS